MTTKRTNMMKNPAALSRWGLPLMICGLMGAFQLLPTTASAQWLGFVTNHKPAGYIDIDADFNGDGVISNDDPGDNGAIQVTPPGLYTPIGRLTEIVLRYKLARPDYRGDTAINLEVRGINRSVKSGKFASLDDEIASAGRIKVWSDRSRSQLLLDSGNPEMRTYTWTKPPEGLAKEQYSVPQNLFIEGVSPSSIPGGIQLIAWISYNGKITRFTNTHDYILVTVGSPASWNKGK